MDLVGYLLIDVFVPKAGPIGRWIGLRPKAETMVMVRNYLSSCLVVPVSEPEIDSIW